MSLLGTTFADTLPRWREGHVKHRCWRSMILFLKGNKGKPLGIFSETLQFLGRFQSIPAGVRHGIAPPSFGRENMANWVMTPCDPASEKNWDLWMLPQSYGRFIGNLTHFHPIGSACMPWSWFAIYHQYTPVMLAYIPYIRILWVIKPAYISWEFPHENPAK